MRQETRFKFNAYLSRVAELNGIDAGDVSKKFTVEPSVTQTLMNTMQESSDFLTRINIVPVSEMKGEKIGIGVTGSIASTTDTAGGTERQPKDFSKLASNKYECDQINFDFYIRYKTLDLWARYQDFQLRIRNAIIKRQSLDFIMAGFNGVKRAETSDRNSNPMLQDVAVGWLQKYRNEAPARVMSKVTDEEGHTTSEVIRVGKGGDYASLDALVMDATNNLIEPWYQEDPDLVVIVGRQLLADKYFPIVNKEQDNSYYVYCHRKEFCEKVLRDFGIAGKYSHIINGHVPVRTKLGENPVKAEGKLIVIDGGFCKAYHEKTGIAGYTLIYNSHGLRLCAHEPFDSIEKAIEQRKDIHSEVTVFETRQNRLLVRDTDTGKELEEQLAGLKFLLDSYAEKARL